MKTLNILVELGHPAHVHFFRHPIQIWRAQGHQVLIVTRDKEITHALLDEFGLDYLPLSQQQPQLWSQALELLVRWARIFWLIKRRRIDAAISISGISTAFPAWLAGIPAITDTDTEDARLSNAIAFRFSDVILTPDTFLHKDNVKRLTAYPALHELAYLHPNRFTPDPQYLTEFGLTAQDKYIFIRLVKWKAVHDLHEHGLTEDHLREILAECRQRGYKVIISAERPLAPEFSPYLVHAHFSRIFHVLAFASGYVGDSPTMAVETALLGRPAALINSRVRHLGNMIELQEKYGLLYNFERFDAAREFIRNDFFSDQLQQRVERGRQQFLAAKIDLAAWIADFLVDYCRSKTA